LVRPNQGLIEPGGAQTVQILLVEKEKNSLLQSYERLGQPTLDQSKDKFLVQSVAILDASKLASLKDYDELTSLWATVGNSPSTSTSAVANKKLHVKHVVAGNKKSGSGDGAHGNSSISREPIENLTQDQAKAELTNMRRKYDELVAFSVNLTAERDMLNNTLEQTKRDLNRELSKTAAQDNASGRGRAAGNGSAKPNAGVTFVLVFLLSMASFFGGIKLQEKGLVKNIPILGNLMTSGDEL
jgi:hypothetical protein